MNTTTKLYIANKGWTGKTVHAVEVEENEAGEINMHNGTNNNICYRWETTVRPITNLKKVQATVDNVTCKNCLKQLTTFKKYQ